MTTDWKPGQPTDDELLARLPKLDKIERIKSPTKLGLVTRHLCGLGHWHHSHKQAADCHVRWRKTQIAKLRKGLAKAEKESSSG